MDLINAIIQVESGGDDNAIGDRNLTYSAYGCLQCRWPCVLDVNNHYGTKYHARDCLGHREISTDIFNKYIAMYANAHVLKREPTDVDRMRLWNGGIGGMIYNPHPNPRIEKNLQDYVAKVEHYMNLK